jgi:3-hydroxyisobutyrate dehydrogenase-like beta-hydroxyacid dehydrogenase
MADVKRQAEAAPRAEDFAKEAGAVVTHGKDGTWTATVRGIENIRRAVHMQNGSRKVEIERGAKLDASRPKERLVSEDGRFMDAPVHLAEQIAKSKGLKPKRHYGRPSERWVARNGELVRVL